MTDTEAIEAARQNSIRAEDMAADLHRLQQLMSQTHTIGDDGQVVIAAVAGVDGPDMPPATSRRYRNAVDELRANSPALVDAATRGGRPPGLFAEGDLPYATASGIEPAALRALPWRARLVAAWEPNRAKAFRIAQDYGGPDGEDMSRLDLSGHAAVVRHVSDVENWARTSGVNIPEEPTADEVKALYPQRRGAQRQGN